MDDLKEQICEILFKRSEYTRISEMNGLHQLHEREFDNVAEEILGLFEQRQETRPHETIVMWRSVEDELPESEEEEYAVTDGQSFYMAYFGFNHKTKKTEFSSTSDDFNSLYGCKGITHWAKIDDSIITAT